MKINIIGNNIDYFQFLINKQQDTSVEFTDNIQEANMVIFSGTFNYRSAVTKFNKITKDQIVLAVGKTGIDFINKRYNNPVTVKNVVLRASFVNNSLNAWDQGMNQYECIPQQFLLIPDNTNNTATLLYTNYVYFQIRNISVKEREFMERGGFPIILFLDYEDKPKCLMLNLEPKYISKTSTGRFFNNILSQLQCKL